MAENNSDLLALMGDVLRAVDRQTEENKKSFEALNIRLDQCLNRWETVIARFGQTADKSIGRIETATTEK